MHTLLVIYIYMVASMFHVLCFALMFRAGAACCGAATECSDAPTTAATTNAANGADGGVVQQQEGVSEQGDDNITMHHIVLKTDPAQNHHAMWGQSA